MPRKPNYGFDKRRKEQDRKARTDAKMQEKQRRREQAAAENRLISETDAGDATQPAPPSPNEER